MFGLDVDTLQAIRETLARFPQIEKVRIYGSRARGNYKKGSDIDITLIGKGLTLQNTIYPLTRRLDDLYLPYKFDISIFNQLGEADFIDHILRVGKTFYQREGGMREEWEQCKIKDIVHPLTTIDPRKSPGTPFKYIDVSSVSRSNHTVQETVTLSGFDAPSRARRKVQVGDVLFATIRPTLQRIAVVPEHLDGAICSTGYYVLRPRTQALSKYLFYYLFSHTFADEMATLQRGAAYPAVSDRDVKEHAMYLPLLPKQKQIVAILDKAFAAIATATTNTEKNLANAKELFDSELNRIFSQRGDNWVKKKLGELGQVQTGSTPKTVERGNFGDFIPFIKPPDFRQDGTLDFNNEGLSKSGLSGSRLIKAGSVLMVCIGTIGKAGTTDRNIATNQQINALTPSEGVSSRFLYYQMLTSSFQMDVLANSGQTTLPIINKTKWSNLELWLPQNIQEQERIVSFFDGVSRQTRSLKSIYQRKLTALTELKQSLLHKAFTGELTADPKATDRTLSKAGV